MTSCFELPRHQENGYLKEFIGYTTISIAQLIFAQLIRVHFRPAILVRIA
jgi:hypothetical protein